MSIRLGKRDHLNTSNETIPTNNSKRYRTTESLSDRQFVYFSSTSYQENLNKLSILFPTMENQILFEYLKKANNSFEDTITLLKNPQVNPNNLSRHYANYLITNLQLASKDKALDIATNIFNQFFEAIQISRTDNVMNKNFKAGDMDYPMEEIQEFVEEGLDFTGNLELKNEIQELNKANNMLRMHLQERIHGINIRKND
ncbi:hypothetical protein SteCoe_22360 [Stentor coeruleus]|uniref:CUE domain-containing protein n=1 Tax=Stentor coeruleus TaxID=5963 RepID=A0A1R2BMK6_9CILI|nr:hypothetical protein SteCoe_22360 [Stentor coeruleus]